MSDSENNQEDDVADSNHAMDQVNSAGDKAFEEALDNGASPEEAFDAACAAREETALEAGIPQEEIEAQTEAAKEAFNQGLEEGKDPKECYDEANDAGGFNEGGQQQPFDEEHPEGEGPEGGQQQPFDEEHPEGEGPDSNNALDQVNSAGDKAFEEALDNGASPEEAFDAACAAREETALEAGIPQELSLIHI